MRLPWRLPCDFMDGVGLGMKRVFRWATFLRESNFVFYLGLECRYWPWSWTGRGGGDFKKQGCIIRQSDQ